MSRLHLVRGIETGFEEVSSEPVRPGLWNRYGRGWPGIRP